MCHGVPTMKILTRRKQCNSKVSVTKERIHTGPFREKGIAKLPRY
jgi:hypothetical protein